jgi:hypothetical protein
MMVIPEPELDNSNGQCQMQELAGIDSLQHSAKRSIT